MGAASSCRAVTPGGVGCVWGDCFFLPLPHTELAPSHPSTKLQAHTEEQPDARVITTDCSRRKPALHLPHRAA